MNFTGIFNMLGLGGLITGVILIGVNIIVRRSDNRQEKRE